jgi:anti-anti-sigma factor
VSELARVEVASRDDGLCLLRITGEIDISNVPQLTADIEAAVPNGAPTVALDLSETTYVDSSGIQLLLVLAERLRTRRHTVRLIVPEDSPIRAVLELSGVPALIPLEPRIEDPA